MRRRSSGSAQGLARCARDHRRTRVISVDRDNQYTPAEDDRQPSGNHVGLRAALGAGALESIHDCGPRKGRCGYVRRASMASRNNQRLALRELQKKQTEVIPPMRIVVVDRHP
jgi:hypothetical protein